MAQPVIDVRNLTKEYQMGTMTVHALRGVTLQVMPGETTAIMGPSGSGKSTLMNQLGCLDQPTSGEYYLDGTLVSQLNEAGSTRIRPHKIGFVFGIRACSRSSRCGSNREGFRSPELRISQLLSDFSTGYPGSFVILNASDEDDVLQPVGPLGPPEQTTRGERIPAK